MEALGKIKAANPESEPYIEVRYHGSGDSSDGCEATGSDCIDAGLRITFDEERREWVDGGWQISTRTVKRGIFTAASDAAMELADEHFGGWENDDGADGEVTFTPDGVTISHDSFYQERENTTLQLVFDGGDLVTVDVPEPEASFRASPDNETNASAEKRWNEVCYHQGWNDASRIIHLEGFIRDRGLFGALAAYAESAAAEENGDV